MPTTRKQKKARRSRGLEILSDIENLDIMLGENHFNDMRRDESLDETSVRRQESVTSNNLENEEMDLHSDHKNPETGTSAGYDRITASIYFQAEINKLSCELNSRISREMDEMMNSVSSQIQRAISDAINNQVLPQIQNVIMAGSGQETRRGWERSDERPENYSEVQHNAKTRTIFSNAHGGRPQRNVHDTFTSIVRLNCTLNEILFLFCNNFFAQYIVDLQYIAQRNYCRIEIKFHLMCILNGL